MADEHRGFRPDDEGTNGGDPTENVRIIGLEDDQEPALRFDTVNDTGPLPHWTEPPTGEVPRIFGTAEAEDDLDAWSGLTGQAPVWREDRGRFDDDLDFSALADEQRLGAPDDSEHPEDPFFDELPPVSAAETASVTAIRPRRAGAGRPTDERSRTAAPTTGTAGRNMPQAVATGVVIAAMAVVLFALGPKYAMGLVVLIIVAAAVELFDAFRRVGYQPATLAGLVACAAMPLAAYWVGESGLPLVMMLTVVVALLWYLWAEPEVPMVPNTAVTVLSVAYVGMLGSYAALMLRLPNGTGILLGVIVCTVAYDVGGLFVGSSAGRSPLAPNVSPGKTVEGLIGGCLAAVLAGVVLNLAGLTPWDDKLVHAFQLGVVVAIAAPVGDLVESKIKRDLGVKDMGTILPGHGGVLDRFDAFLFGLPAVYYLCVVLNIS
jgi:phosphatidate cytidylyltransferase